MIRAQLRPESRMPSESGQSMIEFALTFPLFLGVLIGLVGLAVLFYSYVTLQLAAREGASAIIHNTQLTPQQVQDIVRSMSISLDPSALNVQVEPDTGDLNRDRIPGTRVTVTVSYTVPLPSVSIPNFSGSSFRILGPLTISAVSNMTIE